MDKLKVATDAPSLLRVVEDLVPLVREHAGEGERDRQLPKALVTAFTEAGVFRMCRPKGLGGLEVDPLTVIQVCERLAWADGASGWCAMISGAGSVFGGLLSPQGGAEIFSTPDVVQNGSFALTGQARAVDGGYRISGRWSFMSGANYAHWFGGNCVVFGDQGPKMTPFGPEVLVASWKASDTKIHDTWDAAGLRGSGSHDVEVTDLFVPTAHIVRFPPTGPTHPGPLFAFPFWGFLAMSIASTALGIARAAIDELTDVAKVKTPFGMMSSLATRPSAQIAIAEADGGPPRRAGAALPRHRERLAARRRTVRR